jgi:hypothetical protein
MADITPGRAVRLLGNGWELRRNNDGSITIVAGDSTGPNPFERELTMSADQWQFLIKTT